MEKKLRELETEYFMLRETLAFIKIEILKVKRAIKEANNGKVSKVR